MTAKPALARPLATTLAVGAVALAALAFGGQSFGQAPGASVAVAGKSSQGGLAFGSPLVCPRVLAPSAAAAVRISMEQIGAKPLPIHIAQAREAMGLTGYPVKAPEGKEAVQSASQVSWLMLHGHVVAAKMLNDALAKVPGYGDFAAAMEAHLTVVTQPVQSNDDMARELGQSSAPSSTTAPADLAGASASLREVIRRVSTVQVAMGDLYRQPPVRFYLLSHGFKDAVGLMASAHAVCSLSLSATQTEKLNVSARYMAMPPETAPPRQPAAAPTPVR